MREAQEFKFLGFLCEQKIRTIRQCRVEPFGSNPTFNVGDSLVREDPEEVGLCSPPKRVCAVTTGYPLRFDLSVRPNIALNLEHHRTSVSEDSIDQNRPGQSVNLLRENPDPI